jgi:hypothetical protein
MKAVQNLLKFIILKERTIWIGMRGGERKQTERQTDRQIKRYVSEGNGREKREKEKMLRELTLRFRTLCIKMYILRYIHYTIKQRFLLYCTKNISITLLKGKVPLWLLQ